MSNQIKEIEDKISDKSENKPITEPTTGMTFASVVKSKKLRAIIEEARNEEFQEDRDKKPRRTNVVINGVPDKKFEDPQKQEIWNNKFSNKLLLDLKLNVNKRKAIRLGTFKENKQRPIKVVFATVEDKDTVMKNLKHLKGVESYGKMRITDDHTKAERELIKSCATKAKELNAKNQRSRM